MFGQHTFRISGRGIAMFRADIHSVYVRIPSKGITMFRLTYIQCMLGSRVRGSPYIDSYGMMMMIPVKRGIRNGLNEDKHV